jgi:hypothetical protein
MLPAAGKLDFARFLDQRFGERMLAPAAARRVTP